jgi:hypothetical protein
MILVALMVSFSMLIAKCRARMLLILMPPSKPSSEIRKAQYEVEVYVAEY